MGRLNSAGATERERAISAPQAQGLSGEQYYKNDERT